MKKEKDTVQFYSKAGQRTFFFFDSYLPDRCGCKEAYADKC
jgi:hypothetical protein